jgi:outer membrane protein TolC
LIASGSVGCLQKEKTIHYLGGQKDLEYYRDQVTEIDYAVIDDDVVPEKVAFSNRPRTIRDRIQDKQELWEMTLQEAVNLALANNKVVRQSQDFNTQVGQYILAANRILNSPDQTPTVFDPSIQATGVLFGARGVEAALAAFDTQFSTNMVWGRNETIQNNRFASGGLPAGFTLNAETGQFSSGLTKNLSTGGQFAVTQNWNYLQNNSPGNLFPSVYTGSAVASLTQPLWAGAGTEFTRIAGPIGQTFQGISGVTQGVAIARINEDISLADFELNVMNMVFDVERCYWDLYAAYRAYDASVANGKSSLRTWREVKAKFDIGARGGSAADEALARETYFQRRAAEEAALRNIDTLEVALRRMCGLPVNDGRIIRPVDEPITAEFIPDWNVSLAEALTRHVSLRQQKWRIKSLDLQLLAAKSLAYPQLNLVSSYQLNGFGDKLWSQHNSDPLTNFNLNSAYGTLIQGNQTGWTMGFQFNMPLGFRLALSQIRNIELRLAKTREMLSAQEQELSYDMARAFQDMAMHWTNAQTNFNRRRAAEREVQAFTAEYEAGTRTLDFLLQAQGRLADAETAYYTSITEYNKVIAFLNHRKGTLLDNYNVHIAEGQWSPEAYREALRRAWARTYAIDTDVLHAEPAPFASPVNSPVSLPDLDAAAAASEDQPLVPPQAPGVEVPEIPESPDMPLTPPSFEQRGPQAGNGQGGPFRTADESEGPGF